jgi:bacteriocin-like protein
MKKSNIQKRKLTKNELKEINGGAGNCQEGLCKLKGVSSHFMIIGPVGKNGYCC